MICISIGNISDIKLANNIRPPLAEIRYDLIDEKPDEIAGMLTAGIRQVATCRPGKYSDEQREVILKRALEIGAEYVDVEIESDPAFIKTIEGACLHAGADLIVSYHNYEHTPSAADLKLIYKRAGNFRADVIKIATLVNSNSELLSLLSIYELDGRKVVVGMGEQGKITRMAAVALGSEFTFASVDNEGATAPGQLSYSDIETAHKILNIK